ncbi:trypsin-like serine peptidase [Ruegeria sp.]|uniref:trypsin-like serine peptidase n=1 Tax=Ruegeria sp. TaxID=1879320 RepID=UPI003C7AD12E
MIRNLIVLAALTTSTTLLAEESAWPHQEGAVDILDIAYPPIEEGGPAINFLWQETFERPGAQFIQLELLDDSSGASSSFIEITNFTGNVVQKISAQELSEAGTLFTHLVPGQSVTVSVRGVEDDQFGFKIVSINYDKSGARFESISEPDEREHVGRYTGEWELLDAVERSVAKLSYLKNKNGVRKRYVCTGFMVSDSTMITNHHCVATADVCKTTKVLFGYQKSDAFFTAPKEQFGCVKVLKADRNLDVALLELDGKPGAVSEWGSLKLSSSVPVTGQKLFLVQHPAGEPKQISDYDCSVSKSPVNGYEKDLDLAHECDTLGGSSGSPVFNEEGEVIALHHLGMSRSGEFSTLNRAVLSWRIVKFLGN